MSIWIKLALLVSVSFFTAFLVVAGTAPANAQIVPAEHADNYWDEGEAVGAGSVCKTLEDAERIAREYETSGEAGNNAWDAAVISGVCFSLPGPLPATMIERFGQYQVPGGPILELWSVLFRGGTLLMYAVYELPSGYSSEIGV